MEETSPQPLPTPQPPSIPKKIEKPVKKETPPVFIKVDKYEEIVKALQNLKSKALTLRDALDALDDMEKELRTAIALSHKALDYFNEAISILDARLLKIEGIEPEEAKENDMDSYIKGIHDQIEKIKSELKTIASE